MSEDYRTNPLQKGKLEKMSRRLLSSSEKEYIRLGVEEDIRADGRKRLDFRQFEVEVDVVPQAAGSARVRLGRTEVLVSIKTDIGRPDLAAPGKGNILCSVDAASGAAASAAAGSGMGAMDVEDKQKNSRLGELSTALTTILKDSGGINLRDLLIVEGKHCWLVYVDVLILDEDGNMMDAIMLATRAALSRTSLPGVTIEEGGEETEIVLSDDPALSKTINVSSIPLTVTINQLGRSYLVDATVPEEICSEAAVTMAVDKAGRILYSKKQLAGMVDPSLLMEILQAGQRLALSLLQTLDAELDKNMPS